MRWCGCRNSLNGWVLNACERGDIFFLLSSYEGAAKLQTKMSNKLSWLLLPHVRNF